MQSEMNRSEEQWGAFGRQAGLNSASTCLWRGNDSFPHIQRWRQILSSVTVNGFKLLLITSGTFATCAAGAQDYYQPVNQTMAEELEIEVSGLRKQLGISRAAEAVWAERERKLCASTGLVPSKCSRWGKSLEDRKALADTGDPILQNKYAHSLGLALTTPEAQRESTSYMLAAAGQGMPHAQVSVGWSLLHGLNIERDVVSAFEWNLKGAHQGHPEGASNVAFQYANGIGVAKNYDLALLWYSYAALRGSLIALGSMLQMKRDGY